MGLLRTCECEESQENSRKHPAQGKTEDPSGPSSFWPDKVVLRTLMVLTAVWAVWQFMDQFVMQHLSIDARVSRWYFFVSGLMKLVPFAAVVLMLFLIERLLLRWMIPADNPRCPRCGFAIDSSMAKCPECGLTLRQA